MSKADEALACFARGFACSQAILSTYCAQFGLDAETALKISCGLGAGMGRMGETCGAVSAAYLLIGLKHGRVRLDDYEAKPKTYALVREFAERFTARNNSTRCAELLGLDLLTAGQDTAAERFKAVCPKLVRDAAEIVEEILQRE